MIRQNLSSENFRRRQRRPTNQLYALVVKIYQKSTRVVGAALLYFSLSVAARADALFGDPGLDVFAVPSAARTLEAAASFAATGRFDAARSTLDPLLARAPEWPEAVALDALIFAGQGDAQAAVAALRRAAALGFAEIPALLATPAFRMIDIDPSVAALELGPSPTRRTAPAIAADGEALITGEAVSWRPDLGMLEARVTVPPPRRRPPAIDPKDESRAAAILNRLVLRGQAAGNIGDLYVNRDRGHSTLSPGDHPQLTFARFDDAARAAGVDYGLNDAILFDAPTIGNSSTAIVSGALKRSLPRLAMTDAGRIARAAALYASNQFYIYPETEDHDPERGDRFPAATPYMLISQGSSGSDRPFLRAAAMALAALRPDAKAALRREGLIAPTLQMLLRRAMAADASDEAYLSPEAHPSAFDARRLDLEQLVTRANGLRAEEIPPAPSLRLVAEPPANALGPVFADGYGEALFATPSAIAFVFRAPAPSRTYRLAVDAADPSGRDLRFHWRVIRGDAARVVLTPLDADGSTAEVRVFWRDDDVPAPGRDDLASRRIDVAVFADNGANLSAPAFFSVSFPPGQSREIDEDGRTLVVDHRVSPGLWRDADPLLYPLRDWRDEFLYDGNGALLGWRRIREAATEETFTRHGLRVIERDPLGRPDLAEAMAYPVHAGGDGRRRVRSTPTGQVFRYVYDGPEDRLGAPTPARR